jgi:hypothetical protein
VATRSGNKRGMQHYGYIRDSLEEAVAVPLFLEVPCEVTWQVFPEGLGRNPADLVASDDGELPGRGTGVYQDPPRSFFLGEFPTLE